MALEEIFDANLEGPGIWKWRHYLPAYERHLARFRDARPVVAEVGIFSGGSLGMWHRYFGKEAVIHGIDLDPRCKAYAGPRTHIHVGDQADRSFWSQFRARVPVLDILIDDGGHLAHQQTATFEEVFPHLAPGGVFICEDVHGTSHLFSTYIAELMAGMHAMGDRTAPGTRSTSGLQRWIESISVYPFMVVVEKRRAPLLALEACRRGTSWQPSDLRSAHGRRITGRGG